MTFLEKLITREDEPVSLLQYIDKIFTATRENDELPDFPRIKDPISVWRNRLLNEATSDETLLAIEELQEKIDDRIANDMMDRLLKWTGDFHAEVIDSIMICGVSCDLRYSYEHSMFYIVSGFEYESDIKLNVPFVNQATHIVGGFIDGWLEHRLDFGIRALEMADAELERQEREKLEKEKQ